MSLTDYQHEAVMEQNHETVYELMMHSYYNATAEFDESDPEPAKALEIAEQFKSEMEILESETKKRKDWLDAHMEMIASESEKYGKNGHNGYSFKLEYRTNYKFDAIPEWCAYERAKKQIEEKAKLGLKMVDNGIPTPMDGETGEALPIANFTVTSYLKTTKIKSK